ncbi:amino acid adenylation domain-containing protein [Maritalea mobilis]|uniref:Amino acid adenylation domain-containing protein n=1 Tax=Maritalea mobilis TaxID=483324 RepID=A0A4R6VU72_9HYPH|nr:non-ribosomal peptide synthetase [Maritalea mobilis]TDQ66266.1 amino acid adenylation domain-containing protein [Maritalea mobilis]
MDKFTSLAKRFHDVANEFPHHIAVEDGSTKLTYRELDSLSDQFAHGLTAKKIEVGSIVGLMLPRSWQQIVAILGIVKAGAVAAPLDRQSPKSRIKEMAEDIGCALILVDAKSIKIGGQRCSVFASILDSGKKSKFKPHERSKEALSFVFFTSGSTGKPKAVLVPERGVLRLGMQGYIPLDEHVRVGHISNPSFDAINFDIWAPLLNGGTCIVFPDGAFDDFSAFSEQLVDHNINTLFMTVALFNAIVAEQEQCFANLSTLLIGGEQINTQTVLKWYKNNPKSNCTIYNVYGPTECATFSLNYPIPRDEKAANAPIGRPLPGTKLTVVDADLQKVNDGQKGELLISGDAVALGYHERQELNDQAFVKLNGKVHYRTGDLVQRNADGTINYVGRIGRQVKVRGFRVEPGEIETILNRHPEIENAHVMAAKSATGVLELHAFVVPDGKVSIDDVHAYLQMHLPTYMMPHHFYRLTHLPTNANGKIDREALIEADHPRWQPTNFATELSPEVKALRDIAAAVLEQPDLDASSTFLSAGGDSLSALRFKHQVARELSLSLSAGDILSLPLKDLRSKATAIEEAAQAFKQSPSGISPATSEQKRLWLDAQRYPESRAYSVPLVFKIAGPVDAEKLEHAFSSLFKHYASFRTAFREVDGELMQVVLEESACTFEAFRAGKYKAKDWEGFAKDAFAQPFDLSEPALCWAYWLPFNGHEGVLLINAHHILLDGWSLNLMLQQLSSLYGGDLLPDDAGPEMGQFALWQREQFSTDEYAAKRKALHDLWTNDDSIYAPLTVQCACDEMDAFVTRKTFGAEAAQIVRRCASVQNVTPFNLYLTAFSLGYAHITGLQNFKLATPVSNRTNPAFAETIGMMANTMLLPVRLPAKQSLNEALATNCSIWAEFLQFDEVAFEHFIEDLTQAGHASAGRFDAMFVLENTDYDQLQLAQCRTKFEIPSHVDGKAPITAFVLETADGPELIVEAQSRFFTQEDVDRLCESFGKAIDGLADLDTSIGQFTLPLIDELSAQSTIVAPKTIAEMFQQQAALTPSTIAVVDGYHWLSYRALIQHSWKLIDELKVQLGDRKSGDVIGVYIQPSREHIVALIALAQMNITILPLDPSYPDEMLQRIVEKAKPSLILTHPKAEPRSFADVDVYEVNLNQPSQNKPASHDGENPLYLLFTSGSTGEPKGVYVPDDALCNLLQWQKQEGTLAKAAITQQFSKLSFDVSFQEIFTTLTTGGTFHIIEPELRQDPAILLEEMRDKRIERIFLPFVALKLLAETALRSGIILPYLKEVVSAGEELVSTQTLKAWFKQLPQARLINHYGPSETHVVSAYNLPEDVDQWPDSAPIGRPISNVSFRIKDAQNSEDGSGELLVSGDFVRPCYADDKDNDKAFETDAEGRVWYKTGDRAAIVRNYHFAYRSRLDNQIKLSGHRVELQQIEAVLNRMSGIALAIVVQKSDSELACFYEANGAAPTLSKVNAHLAKHLPDYVRLNSFVAMENWPKTPSGKIDRKKLQLQKIEQELHSDFAEIDWGNQTERQLADLFKDIIHREIRPEQTFFEAGATSLDLIRYRDSCQSAFSIQLPVALLFQFSSIEKLAQHLGPQEETKSAPKSDRHNSQEKMAIVGVSINVAGAENYEAFTDLVLNNRTGIERFDAEHGKIGARSQLKNMMGFDPTYFGISKPEAKLMDPQQRHLLMGAVHCLQDAGVNPQHSQARIGVMASAGENTYFQQTLNGEYDADLPDSFQVALHHDKDFLGSKIAYRLGLKGPAIAVQAACGSSLIGLHMAAGMLRNGDADMMLVGGCLIDATLQDGYTYRPQHIFSKDGLCRPFDRDASGTIGASGYGFVLLMPLSKALDAGHKVYAVFEGSAINNDGHDKMSYTAPSVQGQTEVLQAALGNAGLSADDITFIEAHGTGTALGDPIEIEALRRAYGERDTTLAVSSLKSQIGHMGAAAGLVGLIRAIVALKTKTLPPNLNFKALNPEIALGDTPIHFPAKSKTWACQTQRRAGVSSFGIGGTNAHAIVGEFETLASKSKQTVPLFLLSAHSHDALVIWAKQIADYLEQQPDQLNNVLSFLQYGTPHLSYRAGFVCADAKQAVAALRKLDDGRKSASNEQIDLAARDDLEERLERWLSGAHLSPEITQIAPRPQGFPLYSFMLENFEFAKKGKAQAPANLNDIRRLDAQDWLYAPAWQNLGRLNGPSVKRDLAIILHADGLDAEAKAALASNYEQVHFLKIGDDVAEIIREIDQSDPIAAVDVINFAPAQLRLGVSSAQLDHAQIYCLDAIPAVLELAQHFKASKLRIVLASCEAADVYGANEAPLAGLLAGAQSVLTSECDLAASWIDFANGCLEDLNDFLTLRPVEAGRYAVRNGCLWQRQLAPMVSSSLQIEGYGGRHLVIGASGGIGRNICLEILSDPNAELDITTRSGQLPEALANYADRITVHALDLAQEDATLPKLDRPVENVVFAAGAAHGALIAHRDNDAMRQNNKVKTQGLLKLESWVEIQQPKRVIYCSSMASEFGGRGQLDYAATNGLLDSFSHWINPNAPDTVRTVINWDIWRESGMAVDALERDDLHQLHLTYGLSDHEGRSVFRRCLASSHPQICVSTVALKDAVQFYRASEKPVATPSGINQSKDEIIIDLIQSISGETEVSTQHSLDELGIDSLATLDLIDEIKAALGTEFALSELPPVLTVGGLVELIAGKDSSSDIAARLSAMLQSVLGLDTFAPSNSFGELGLDSLMALDLIDEIKAAFGVSLPVSAFHEDATLNDVVQYVEEGLEDGEVRQGGESLPVSVDCWQQGDGEKVICFIHPVGGEVASYKSLFQHLDKATTVYAISDPNLRLEPGEPLTIQARAKAYLQALDQKTDQERQILELVGWSFGAWVAAEMCRLAEHQDNSFGYLTMIDPPEPDCGAEIAEHSKEEVQEAFLHDLAPRLNKSHASLQSQIAPELQQHLENLVRCCQLNMAAMRAHVPGELRHTKVHLFVAGQVADGLLVDPIKPQGHMAKWGQRLPELIYGEILEADHYSIMQSPNIERIAEQFFSDHKQPIRVPSL